MMAMTNSKVQLKLRNPPRELFFLTRKTTNQRNLGFYKINHQKSIIYQNLPQIKEMAQFLIEIILILGTSAFNVSGVQPRDKKKSIMNFKKFH